MEIKTTSFAQRSSTTPSQYAGRADDENLHCGDMYVEFALIKILLEDLDALICHSMREYEGVRKTLTYTMLRSMPNLYLD